MTDFSDGCVRRKGHDKQASGIIVYLIEELGDARLRTAQLKKYVQDAVDLIDKSKVRDQLFEEAGHLIHGIPDTLFKLDKALDASALAAARLDYEEIKQNLKPEKADELEGVLQDIRLPYLKRRSSDNGASNEESKLAGLAERPNEGTLMGLKEANAELSEMQALLKSHGYDPKDAAKLQKDGMGSHELEHRLKQKGSLEHNYGLKKLATEGTMMKTTKDTSDELMKLAKITEASGNVPTARLLQLITSLEGGKRTAGDVSKKAARFFEQAATTLTTAKNPSRVQLATVLRRVLADAMQMDAGTMQSAIFQQASSREDVMKGFQKANPSMSDEDAEKAADMWEKHKNVVKDKH